jgi:hypothetical protein
VVLLCGGLGQGATQLDALGAFALVQPIADGPITLDESMARSAALLTDAAARLARAVGIGLDLARR